MIAAMYAVTMLAAMLVLMTPWSAWAESAWVLWMETVIANTRNVRGQWLARQG
jgi:hypothetical protein